MGVASQLDVTGATCRRSGSARSRSRRSTSRRRYATLAAGGVHAEPMAIRRVVLADGTVGHRRRLGRPDVAGGRSRRARPRSSRASSSRTCSRERAPARRSAAGGRQDRDERGARVDAWFAGYTPELATTVWMGYTKGEIPMENVHGIAVTGGSFPAEIWRLFMEPALEATEPRRSRSPTSGRSGSRSREASTRCAYDPNAATETTDETETTEEPERTPPASRLTPSVRETAPGSPCRRS